MRAMFAEQPKDRKRFKHFILMLGLSETVDQLAMANSVCWHGDVLKKEDDHVLRSALGLEIEGQII